MKRGQILFLRAVILLIGFGVLALMLWEPHLEGRNANADLATIYFRDPFLAYAYTGSLPFFYGLYQAFMLLGYVGRGEAFSPAAVRASRRIKYCALLVIGFIAGAVAYIILHVRPRIEGVDDDNAGAVAMGIVTIFAGIVTAAAAAVLERVLQSAAAIKSENDLTV